MAHLSEQTLERLAEGELPAAEQREASAHLEQCARCTAELQGYRALFDALAGLPRFAPSPGFNDAVMARVRVAPQSALAWSWMQRWLPSTRRGWTLLATLSAVPALGMLAAIAWLLTHPAVTAGGLAAWAAGGAGNTAQATWSALVDWGIESGTFTMIGSVYQALAGLPLTLVGAALVVLAVAIPLSAWSLVRLVRTPMRKMTYAN